MMNSSHHRTELSFLFCLSEKDKGDGVGGTAEEFSSSMSSTLGNTRRGIRPDT